MKTVLILLLPEATPGARALPAEALALALAIEACGARVRVLDTHAEHPGFGILAQKLLHEDVDGVLLLVADGQEVDAVRTVRFIREICGTPVAACGPGAAVPALAAALCRPSDAVAATDVLARVSAWLGSKPARLAGKAPLAAFDAEVYRPMQLLSPTDLEWVVEVPLCDPFGSDERRPVAVVARDCQAAGACGALPILALQAAAGGDEQPLTQALQSQGQPWAIRGSAADLAGLSLPLPQIRAAGCVAAIITGNSAAGSVAAASDYARDAAAAGLVAIVSPLLLAQGETLLSLRRTALALFGTDFEGELSVAARSAGPLGFAGGGGPPLPTSLLEDVPLPTQRLLANEAVLSKDLAEDICRLAAAGFPVRGLSMNKVERDGLRSALSRLRPLIDGQRTFDQICRQAAVAPGPVQVVSPALLALALTGRVRGRDPANPSEFFCARPWTGFEIGEEDGLVRVCCWARDAYGDVNEASIAAIWNGSAIHSQRRAMADGRICDVCRPDCPYIQGWMRDEDPLTAIGSRFVENLATSRAEIASRAIELKSLPRYWRVTHSALCNLDCVMCYQDRSSKVSLPESFYSDLSHYYHVMQELVLVGGEPMLIKRLRQLVEGFPHEAYPDAHLATITNGTIADPKTLGLFTGRPMSWVVVSIDAAREETFARIRPPGHLSRVLDGVRAWRALSQTRKFKLVLSYTVMRDNLREMAEFVRLADELEVECQFSLVSGDKGGQNAIDRGDLLAARNEALAAAAERASNGHMNLALASLEALTPP